MGTFGPPAALASRIEASEDARAAADEAERTILEAKDIHGLRSPKSLSGKAYQNPLGVDSPVQRYRFV